jgi:hypothetical protein
VRRVEIDFGAARPVRILNLARPLAIAGITLARVDVRLFDWAGAPICRPMHMAAKASS